MITWESYLPYVLTSIQDCPDEVAIAAVRNAAIDFCHRTGVLYKELEPVSLANGEAEVTLDIPEGYALATLLKGYTTNQDGQESNVNPVARNELDYAIPSWNRQKGTHIKWMFVASGTDVRVVPEPEIATGKSITLTASVTLKPSRLSYQGDDKLFEDYLETIAAGAKWKLFKTHGAPWADEQLANLEMNRFESGVNDAKIRANSSGGKVQKKVTSRRASI